MPRIKINYNPAAMTAIHHDCLSLHMNNVIPSEAVLLAQYLDDVRILQQAFPKMPDSTRTELFRDRKRISLVDEEYVLVDVPC